MDLIPTSSQTIGPFHKVALTKDETLGRMAGAGAKGEPIKLVCRVTDGDGALVNDAMIELWQADADGQYNNPASAFRGFGRLGTNEDGLCVFETIKPGRVPGTAEKLQAPHINVSFFARGLLKRLATRIYFSGDPANGQDSVLSLVPEERRGTLMAHPDPAQPGVWHFEIRLCCENETVFFDV